MPQASPQQQAIIQSMFQALDTPSKDLTKWEENFLESISEQFEQSKSLSERQLEILQRIYDEKTS